MAPPGPPPTPPELLTSWRANPKYANGYKTPKPKKGEPPMPFGMSEGGKLVWYEVVPSLLRMRVLSVEDGPFLETFCETMAAWRDCRDFVAENGFSEAAQQGSRMRPEATMLSKLGGDLVRMADRLGLNPSGRTRLQTNQEEEPTKGKAAKKAAAMKKKYGIVPEET